MLHCVVRDTFVPVLSLRLGMPLLRWHEPGNFRRRQHGGFHARGDGGHCDSQFRRKRERRSGLLTKHQVSGLGLDASLVAAGGNIFSVQR